jgi:hypothetical protein
MDRIKQPYVLTRCPLTLRRYCHWTPRRGPLGIPTDDTCPHLQINRDGKANRCMFHPNMKQLREEVAELRSALQEMTFAYANKDPDFPHQFEADAIHLATKLLPDDPVTQALLDRLAEHQAVTH